MNTYPLQKPFKSRRNQQDVLVEELSVPEILTVGMMRKVPNGNTLLAAHAMVEVCAGLSVIDGSKVETPDAIGYSNLLTDMLTPNEEPGFEIPEIKPVRALIAKITVDINSRPIEFCAQVLQHSGMDRDSIDALDVRDFLPAVQTIVAVFTDPKH